MWNVGQIVEGTVNNILNRNEDLSIERKKICYECPIFSRNLGGQCDHNLWLNPDTNDVSLVEKEGYFKGCGCIINSKTRAKSAKCPAGKW